jgi:type II secretory pathway pseudopilin PulG
MRINTRNLNKRSDYPTVRRSPGLPPLVLIVLLVPAGLIGLGIVAAIAIPSLLKSRNAANTAAALGDLKRLQAAEAVFRSNVSRDQGFGDFRELVQAGLIEPDARLRPVCPTCDNNDLWSRKGFATDYRISLDGAARRYCILASGSGMTPLAAVSDGAIYRSEAGNISCANGEVAGAGLVKMTP